MRYVESRLHLCVQFVKLYSTVQKNAKNETGKIINRLAERYNMTTLAEDMYTCVMCDHVVGRKYGIDRSEILFSGCCCYSFESFLGQ